MSNLTEKAIKDAFLKLLDQMPLSKISEKMIVEECGINRNSFYYHYHDIPSLIEEIVKELVDKVIAEHQTVDTLADGFRFAFQFLLERKRTVFHIYNSVNRDIFEKNLMRLCDYFVQSSADCIFEGKSLPDSDREILITYYKCACFGIALNWLEEGMDEDICVKFQRLFELQSGKGYENINII